MYSSSRKHDSSGVIRLTNLKLLSLLTITLSSLAGIAHAATANWSGLYTGINAGYSWSNADTKFTPLPEPAQLPPGDGNIQSTSLSVPMAGGVLGAQLGYNWQLKAYPKIYVGLETDIDWSGLQGSVTGNATGNNVEHQELFNNVLSAQQKVRWLGTLRGRAGYSPTPSLLIFGFAGLAYGSLNEAANVNFTNGGYGDGQYPLAKSYWRIGGTAGGGIEWMLKQKWSAKLEYVYYNLGSTSGVADPVVANPPFQNQYQWTNPGQVIRLGVNYHFWG